MTVDILTNAECARIMERKCGASNVKILNVHIGPMSASVDGFLGEHYRAIITGLVNNQSTTIQLFIKLLPSGSDGAVQEYNRQTGAYMKEAFLYEEIIGTENLVSWAPQFHLFKNKTTLVLDDISTEGFVMARVPFEGFDVPHCKLALESIAALHAHSILLEHRKGKELGRKFCFGDEYPEIFKEGVFLSSDDTHLGRQWVKAGLAALEALHEAIPATTAISAEAFRAKLDTLTEKIFPWITASKDHRNVICHGDLWMNNMLFKYSDETSPDKCTLIDFQIIRYCVPAHDVMMFLHINTTSEFREQHLDHLLRHYHTHISLVLRQGGVDAMQELPWDEFMAAVPQQTKLARVISILYKVFILLGEDVFKEATKNAESYRQFLFGSRTESVLKQYAENTHFRTRVTAFISDIRDILRQETS